MATSGGGALGALRRAVSRLGALQLLALFSLVNVLNYIDRGIVPGAFSDIGDFIRGDLGLENIDAQLGLLQSMYIVGYALASVSFGHLVRSRPPFQLMAIGLVVWVCAVVLSGLAPHYWVLVLARMLSGVGEASFQCVVPPWIDDNAPAASRGLWLSAFFTAIPFGTAIGFAWGGNLSALLSWRWAFFLEAIPMAPLVPLIFLVPYVRRRGGKAEPASPTARSEEPAASPSASAAAAVATAAAVNKMPGSGVAAESAGSELAASLLGEGRGRGEAALDEEHMAAPAPSFLEELRYVVTQPLFLAVVFGYAGYTAVLAGIGAFGPTIVQGLGLFSSQAESSLFFGLAVSIAGAVGTPLGGFLLDRATRLRRRRDAEVFLRELAEARARVAARVAAGGLSGTEAAALLEGAAGGGDYRERTPTEAAAEAAAASASTDAATIDIKLNVALPQAVLMTLVGGLACAAGIMLGSQTAASFFTLLSLGALALCTTTAGINVAIMASVRPESRSFAIGLGTLLVHALGDVPAPPLIGGLADRLSPVSCAPAGGSCHRSAYGLQVTLVATLCWLAWPVMLWAAAWRMAARRSTVARKRRAESALALDLTLPPLGGQAAPPPAALVVEMR